MVRKVVDILLRIYLPASLLQFVFVPDILLASKDKNMQHLTDQTDG